MTSSPPTSRKESRRPSSSDIRINTRKTSCSTQPSTPNSTAGSLSSIPESQTSPLILAVQCARILLKQPNINDTIPNYDDKKPIDLSRNQEIIELFNANKQEFIEESTSLFRQYVSDSNYIAIQNLFQNPRVSALIDINLQNPSNGTTLLHDATKKKNLEMVKFCLDNGADVTVRDRKGKTPIDVAKDDKIKNLLKQVKPTIALDISTSPDHPPILKGYLHKWTNYAGGYKIRWFVLENAILYYFQNKDDAGNSCRGSINMKIAKISKDTSDTQSSRDEDLRIGRNLHRDDQSNIEECEENNYMGEHSRSSSNDSSEIDKLPYENTYHLTISSVRTQFDLQNRLFESLVDLLRQSSTEKDSKESKVIEAFAKSLQTLQDLLNDTLKMSEERDNYWQKKLDKELEAKKLWEESMEALAIEKTEMETVIQNNAKEEKIMKKHLKAAIIAESLVNSPTSPKISNLSSNSKEPVSPNKPQEDGLIDKDAEKKEEQLSLADIYDSEDEFYDAFDGGPILEGVEPSIITNPTEDNLSSTFAKNTSLSKDVQPTYISDSYNGYPDHARTKFSLDKGFSKPEVSLWSILKNSIGKDLSRIALPVYFNEPTSMLQRMSEDMEYSELLDLAAIQKGSTERILFVAAFAMSNYSSTVGRIAKPFNPLLVCMYVSEQVSHHPPISACYCESPNYDFFSEVDVKSKFWGKSFEALPQGISHARLKVLKECFPTYTNKSAEDFPANGNPKAFSEHYSWKKVTTSVNNLMIGKPWIDHYGNMTITNHLTGDQCILTFKARGWRGKDAFEIRGVVKDKDDKEIWEIAGRWNERLVARRIILSPSTHEEDLGSDAAASKAKLVHELSPTFKLESPIQTSPISTTQPQRRPIVLLWEKHPELEEPLPFNLTPFAMTLNDLPSSLKIWIAPTDSRLRPDQRSMELGDYESASLEKNRLEEKQREKRKLREAGSIPEFQPRWFTKEIEEDTGEKYWKFNHEYWKERERVGREKIQGIGDSKWNIDDDDIF
nr:4208_t:CDS:2 [Entrophospora candida]